MSSGSYFPPAVKGVEIPEAGGRGVRLLGVPTVADRIAQTVAAMYLERQVEPVFQAAAPPGEEGAGTAGGHGSPVPGPVRPLAVRRQA